MPFDCPLKIGPRRWVGRNRGTRRLEEREIGVRYCLGRLEGLVILEKPAGLIEGIIISGMGKC